MHANCTCTETAPKIKPTKSLFINSAKLINLNEKIVILLTLRNCHICLCNLWVSGWILVEQLQATMWTTAYKNRVISLFISVSFFIFHVFDLCEPLFGKAILAIFFYFNFSNFTVIFIFCFFSVFYLFNQNDNNNKKHKPFIL